MEIHLSGVSPCDGPWSTWSAGAPFLPWNLLVVGLWSGWPLWMTSRVCPVSVRLHICVFKICVFLQCQRLVWSTASPSSLLPVSPCVSSSCPLSFSLSLGLLLSCSLSLSHRLVLLTGDWVVCWSGALSGTGANCEQKILKSNKRTKMSHLQHFSFDKQWPQYPCMFFLFAATLSDYFILSIRAYILDLSRCQDRGLNTLPCLF